MKNKQMVAKKLVRSMPPVAEKYNTRIVEIWKEHSRHLRALSGAERFPLVIPETAKTVRVVYSGINPSFKPRAAKRFADAAGCEMEYFNWSPDLTVKQISERVPRLQQFELIARKEYRRYFQPFERLSRDIGLRHENTTHLDLLAIRTGDQARILRELKTLRHDSRVQSFIEAQKSLYAEVLKKLSPEIVLVANA